MKNRAALVIRSSLQGKEHLLELLRIHKVAVIAVDSLDAAQKYLSTHEIDAIFSETPDNLKLAFPHIPYHPFTKSALLSFLQTKNAHQAIIANSPQMKELLSKAAKIAQSEASVFITGESGTGKEVLANFIHCNSKRYEKPFVQVNCAAIPETLLESEFFGHVKGAFTGALADRIGRFETADTGTILLDEVSEIPLNVQAKLLRAIQEQEFEKIGSNALISVSIRFIATSNKNIEHAILNGEFREDLFYRLGVVPLYLPPLRERIDDIQPLAEHFLVLACRKNHLPEKRFTEGAFTTLKKYRWPGNVRELSNVIEHAAVLCDAEQIDIVDLPICEQITPLITNYPFTHLSMKDVEQIHIQHVLNECHNNKTKAAAVLKMSLRTLRNKLNLS